MTVKQKQTLGGSSKRDLGSGMLGMLGNFPSIPLWYFQILPPASPHKKLDKKLNIKVDRKLSKKLDKKVGKKLGKKLDKENSANKLDIKLNMRVEKRRGNLGTYWAPYKSNCCVDLILC